MDFHERVEQAMQAEIREIGELAWAIMPDDEKLQVRMRVTRELVKKDIEKGTEK